MKILLFMPNLGGGGTERAVVNLAKEFSRRGIDVKLVTLEPTADLEADPDAVVCLGFPKSGLRVKRPLYWYGSIRRLIHLMKREQPQALVSFLTGPNYMAAIASLFNRGPRLILSERTVVSTLAVREGIARAGLSYRRRDHREFQCHSVRSGGVGCQWPQDISDSQPRRPGRDRTAQRRAPRRTGGFLSRTRHLCSRSIGGGQGVPLSPPGVQVTWGRCASCDPG